MKLKGKADKSIESKIKDKNKNKDMKNKKGNVVSKYIKCYKEVFFRKQFLLFIICLVIFFIAFTIGMSTIDFTAPLRKDVNELANINLIQMQFVFVMVLTPFLALIPFIKKLSVVTVIYSYFMAFNVVNMFYLPDRNKVLLAIFVIFSLLALSINLVLSFELSEIINKKFANVLNRKKDYKNEMKNKESGKEASIDNAKKEEISLDLKRNVAIVTCIACMIITIVSLIITKFI